MALVDDRILEFLSENKTGSPTEMKEEGPIRYSRAYIGRRCKTLAEKDLIRHLGNAVYTITEDGEAYLEGRLDTQNWRYIDEAEDDVDETAYANGETTNGSHT